MWFKIMLLIILALLLAAIAAARYGASRWQGDTALLRDKLKNSAGPILPARYDAADIQSLPEPVQRYFRAVLTDGQPMISSAFFRHEGQFSLGVDKVKWLPFISEQTSTVKRPGFFWNARVYMAPGIPAFVYDAYMEGEGSLHAALLGLLTVADRRDTPDMAQGEMMRFLAETAWYPTALLPGHGVSWEPIDADSARAFLTDNGNTVSLDFTFDDKGLISKVSARRYRLVNNKVKLVPWEGRFWNYQRRDGLLIPIEGEVAWLLPQGRLPYWRGRIVRSAYEFAG